MKIRPARREEEEDWSYLDAANTDISLLFGEFDPFDPNIDPEELECAMDYIMECWGYEDNHAIRSEAAFQISELLYALRGPMFELPKFALNDDGVWFNNDVRKYKPGDDPWIEVKDGDPRLLAVFKDHYSYSERKGGRKNNLVIGPGYKLPLLIPNREDPYEGRPQAIFAWRMERYRADNDYGACCVFFRNETHIKSSELILAAEARAKLRWPYIPRFFTHIDTAKVKPRKTRGVPSWGHSYTMAGWSILPTPTKTGLLRLEKTFMPLAWLDTYKSGTTASTNWPFPERHYDRDPHNGGQPPWRPEEQRRKRQAIANRKKQQPKQSTPQLQMEIFA
jgi:hypothetical protein